MPAAIQKPSHRPHVPKRPSRISKSPKLPAKALSEHSVDTDDTEENIQIQPKVSLISKKDLLCLLKQAHSRLRYGLDTLLACLILLKQIEFEVEERRGRLLVAALLLLGGKVHEFRTPQFMELTVWGEYSFGKEELVAAEGQLLIHFGFKVPTALNLSSIKEAQVAVAQLESQIN